MRTSLTSCCTFDDSSSGASMSSFTTTKSDVARDRTHLERHRIPDLPPAVLEGLPQQDAVEGDAARSERCDEPMCGASLHLCLPWRPTPPEGCAEIEQ
eukprot:4726495-Prymnesium_polylepis.1